MAPCPPRAPQNDPELPQRPLCSHPEPREPTLQELRPARTQDPRGVPTHPGDLAPKGVLLGGAHDARVTPPPAVAMATRDCPEHPWVPPALPSPPLPAHPLPTQGWYLGGGPILLCPPPHGAAPAVGLRQHRGGLAVIPMAPGLWQSIPFPSFSPPQPTGPGFFVGSGTTLGGSGVPVGPAWPRRAATCPRCQPCSDSHGGGSSSRDLLSLLPPP